MTTTTALFVLSLVVLFGAAPGATRPDDEKYTTKYDNVDVDAVLQSDRLLKNYVNCLLDKGHCTPDAAELKRVLPDALQTDCVKCNEKQKKGTKRVITYLIKNRPEIWSQLEVVYDPEGIYRKRYEADLKEISNNK